MTPQAVSIGGTVGDVEQQVRTVARPRPLGVAVVIGGGHAAHALAADLSLAGAEVRMLEHPERRSRLKVVAARGGIEIVRGERRQWAHIEIVTQDPRIALAGADFVIVAVPAFAHRAFAELTEPHLSGRETLVVFTAAFGGLEWRAAALRMGRRFECPIVEAENLPYTCRNLAPAEVVVHIDVPNIKCAVFPAQRTAETARRISPLFSMLEFRRDILEPLLTNMNGVVHPPAVLLNVTQVDRARGEPWWIWEVGVTESVARTIERLDEERRALGAAFGYDLEPVAELMSRSGYGPRGTIYETINGCAALRKVRGPASFDHRWYSEDIPYTLALWADLARCARCDAPVMRALCDLAGAILGYDVWRNGRSLAGFGLGALDRDGLLRFLHTGEG